MTHCPETKQSVKPDSEMIQTVELSKENFKISKSNMLQNLVGKADTTQEQMEKVQQRDGNYKIESKENSRNKNHSIRYEEFLQWFIIG